MPQTILFIRAVRSVNTVSKAFGKFFVFTRGDTGAVSPHTNSFPSSGLETGNTAKAGSLSYNCGFAGNMPDLSF